MKSIPAILLFVIIYVLTSCEKTFETSVLTGSWVEVSEKVDTLTFTSFASNNAVNLDRGYKTVDGGLIPIGGIYYYFVLENDSIALNSIGSSICPIPDPNCYPHYYFKMLNEETITLGNFYDHTNSPELKYTYTSIK